MSNAVLREGALVRLGAVAPVTYPLPKVLVEIGRMNEQLRRALGLRQGPLALQLQGAPELCVTGVAGSLRLFGTPFEIVPKFVDADSWHENLLMIMGRGHGVRFDLDEVRSGIRPHRTFVDHMGLAFVRALERALREGPIETYHDIEIEGYAAFGRIDLRRTVAAALRRPGLIVSRTALLHADNPYNNLLTAAAEALIPIVSDAGIRRQLREVREELPPLSRRPYVPARFPERPPPQYEAYGEALEVAKAILQGRDWGMGAAASTAFGYLVGMERLFEKFVEKTVAYAAAQMPLHLAARVEPQAAARFAIALTAGRRSYVTKPDNILCLNGRPTLLIDAKYKRFRDAEAISAGRPSNSDIYQMFAAMAAHHCRAALLVYPTDQDLEGEPPVWETSIDGSPAYVSAIGLRLTDIRTASDFAEIDAGLAVLMLNLLGRCNLIEEPNRAAA